MFWYVFTCPSLTHYPSIPETDWLIDPSFDLLRVYMPDLEPKAANEWLQRRDFLFHPLSPKSLTCQSPDDHVNNEIFKSRDIYFLWVFEVYTVFRVSGNQPAV